MKVLKTEFSNLMVVSPKIITDVRGSFNENFRKNLINNFIDYEFNIVQINQSISKKNVFRGIHFQLEPYDQSKLVCVPNGEIIDFAIDLRKSSKTFKKTFSIKLSSHNKKSLFIPKGFGHAFISLQNNTIVNYLTDNYYNKDFDSGIIFNDSELDIDWKIDTKKLIISDKDLNLNNLYNSNLFDL